MKAKKSDAPAAIAPVADVAMGHVLVSGIIVVSSYRILILIISESDTNSRKKLHSGLTPLYSWPTLLLGFNQPAKLHMKEKKVTPSDALSDKHATPQIRRTLAKKEISDMASTAGALAKSLDVLEMIMNSPYPPSAAQITEALQLPRPTTNRVISNLVKLSLLKRDVKYRELVEGDRLLKLALQVIARSTQRGPAHEILRELSSITRETCNIGTIAAGRIRYVDRVEADWPLSLRLEPGSYVPLHCTAIGKLLLASLPEPQREKHLQALTLSRNTEKTITRRDILRTRLQEIVEQGYSIDDEEHLPGVIGMAVAVPTRGNYPILGIAVAVPTARASIENLTKHLPMLREYAARLGDCY